MSGSRKSIQKSIRITEEVYKYIDQQNGDGFNEKLCNMVMYCMKKQSDIKNQVSAAEKKLKECEKLINQKHDILIKLRRIESYVENCCNVIQ